MRAGEPVAHLEIDARHGVEGEGVDVSPGVAEFRLVRDQVPPSHEAPRLKAPGLFAVEFEAQRLKKRHAAEADVGEARTGVGGFDTQELMHGRGLQIRRQLPADATDERGDGEAERAQRRAEQRILLEAVAAAAIAHEFPLDRPGRFGCDARAGYRDFERNCLRVVGGTPVR